jgi:hypothetical protein
LGTRGQVDLINFQSMPNGDFRFLLNYLDHGVKFIFGIPLKRKRVSCDAIALLEIFTFIGPPMILQSDNGKEFSGAAMTSREHRGLCVGLNAVELDEVINEIKLLWPECRMVCGSPRHSPSNGGVERLNRTMEEKLGAWMAKTGSTNWSVGCRLMMWRYNTQEHRTVGDVPYRLVFGQMPHVGISSLHLSYSYSARHVGNRGTTGIESVTTPGRMPKLLMTLLRRTVMRWRRMPKLLLTLRWVKMRWRMP